MYAKRAFGEKMNATFDFIKENWKILFKFTTYLMLPLCLIQALSLNTLMSKSMAATANMGTSGVVNPMDLGLTFWMNYGATILCAIIGTMLLSSLVYGLMKLYNEREERLVGITFSGIRLILFRNLGRLVKLFLFSILLVAIVGVIIVLAVMLTPFTMIVLVPLLIACCIPIALFIPIYLFEDISLIGAFKKTFRLGFATWGGIFILALVLNIIAGILQGITMLPWYIATLVKYFFSVSDSGSAATISPLYSFFLYLLGILQTFGTYLSMIIIYIGIAYQYGHASEVVDSVSVEEDIENFDKL